MTMTWLNGRQMASLSKGNTQVTYKYDANGMRTSKTVRDTSIDQTRETKYYYDSNQKLIAIYGLFGNIMHFYYDGDGKINSMSYAGEMYYYVTNLMGDVTKLLKSDGTVAANYEYDAWGKLLSVTDANGKTIGSSMHIGLMNPFRYRGYVYDDETGLYYLQSRYYDPTTGRFVNADEPYMISVTGTHVIGSNLFEYSENSPINNTDPTGHSTASIILNVASMALSYAALFSGWIWVKILVGVALGIASFVITQRDYNKQINKLKSLLKKKKISKKTYDKKVKNAKFWRNLGYIAAGITLVCAILSVPAKWLINRVAVKVIQALGFAKGMVISRASLIYDVVSAFNHKPKYA